MESSGNMSSLHTPRSWQRCGWSPLPHLRIGSGRKNLIDPQGQAGFIDQPLLSVAVIFTALLPDGATQRWQRVTQPRAPPMQEQMDLGLLLERWSSGGGFLKSSEEGPVSNNQNIHIWWKTGGHLSPFFPTSWTAHIHVHSKSDLWPNATFEAGAAA